MDIKEVRKLRKQLEYEISSNVSNMVDDFKRLTGLTPCIISIDMIPVSSVGDTEKTYVVGHTSAIIEV